MKRIGWRKSKRKKGRNAQWLDSGLWGKFFWLARYTRAHISPCIFLYVYVHTQSQYCEFGFFFRLLEKKKGAPKNILRHRARWKTSVGTLSTRGWDDLWYENIYRGPMKFTYIYIYIKYIVIWYTRANIPSLIPHIYICHGHLQRHIIIL